MVYWQAPLLQDWCAALRAGQVVAAPAEGVYGYCCDPFNPQALEALMVLKQRSASKGLIVLVKNVEQMGQICPMPLPEPVRAAMDDVWQPGQGPVTLVVPALPTLPKLLTGDFATLAVRCPQVGYMQEYLEAWGGPLVSTSLNLAGEPAATDAAQVPAGVVALTLPQGLAGQPSRIYDPVKGIWLR